MKTLKYFLPLALFIFMVFFLWRGLSNDPTKLPSRFINKPMPNFQLSTLEDSQMLVSDQDLTGEPMLVNVWATWCVACMVEHSYLMDIANQHVIKIVGLNYKDQRGSALAWLNKLGNPYAINLFDGAGSFAIDWGIYGTPETFLIDKQGKIRYRHVGVVDARVWENTLLPKIKQLEESA